MSGDALFCASKPRFSCRVADDVPLMWSTKGLALYTPQVSALWAAASSVLLSLLLLLEFATRRTRVLP